MHNSLSSSYYNILCSLYCIPTEFSAPSNNVQGTTEEDSSNIRIHQFGEQKNYEKITILSSGISRDVSADRERDEKAKRIGTEVGVKTNSNEYHISLLPFGGPDRKSRIHENHSHTTNLLGTFCYRVDAQPIFSKYATRSNYKNHLILFAFGKEIFIHV